jgi:multidrug efflux pump subunit AcrA (membrane-fusion protein)
MSPLPASNEFRESDFVGDEKKWDDADRWIVDLDRRSRRIGQEAEVFLYFLTELLKIAQASSGHLQLCADGERMVLASIGECLPQAIDQRLFSETQASAESVIRWTQQPDRNEASSDACLFLVGVQTIDRDVRLAVCAKFDKRLDGTTKQRCEEIVTAALDLMTPTFLRFHRQQVDQRSAASNFQETLIDSSFQGESLAQTLASVAAKLANAIGYDRVSILKVVSGRCALVATSTLATVDRRARQVRLLEQLASACVAEKTSIKTIADCDSRVSRPIDESLRQYVTDSGATDIRIDLMVNPGDTGGTGDPIAVVVSERFEEPPTDGVANDQEIESALMAGARAIAIVFARHENRWSRAMATPTDRASVWKRRLMQLSITGILFAIAWLPVELRVHATGRLLPQVRHRIFAPVEGIVTKVHVVNGEAVSKSDPLVEIQSAALDLARQQVISEIATSKVRLASLLAARTRSTSGSGRGGTSGGDFEMLSGGDLAASEETLKAQLAGLEEQLKLIDSQRSVLQLSSPIDGVAMRWDMNQTLHQRPVAAGQFLLEVIATDNGWIVELDVPDAEIGYVQKAFSAKPIDCNFRFRSDPSVSYTGQVSAIDSAAQDDSRGDSVVRVVVPVPELSTPSSAEPPSDVSRVNAGVLASIDCGKRPMIVVYTRGLVRWARVQLGW